MKFLLSVIAVLVLCSAVRAQCVTGNYPQVYQPPSYVVQPQPYLVQPPPVVVRPAPVVVQPVVPFVPYSYRARYWTPVRDLLFGRYRTGLAPAPYGY